MIDLKVIIKEVLEEYRTRRLGDIQIEQILFRIDGKIKTASKVAPIVAQEKATKP